jgi:hypothetical protein
MKSINVFLLLISIIAVSVGSLSGCESMKDPHKSLADLVRPLGGRVMVEGKEVGSHVKADPKTGATQSISSSAVSQSAPKEICTKTSTVSSVDIDTLYARAMSRFTFKTVEQRAHMKTQGYMTDDNYRHTAQTGTYYSLAESVQIKDLPGTTTAGWLELTFAKEGKNVLVTTNTCLDDPSQFYAQSKVAFPAAIAKLVAP